MRKGRKALQFAANRIGDESRPGLCKQFVRESYGIPSQSPSAKVAFQRAKKKHKPKNINDVPAYVPAFFDTGRYGHVVITAGKDENGNRLCISVDVQDRDRDGRKEVGLVRLKDMLKWGPFQGWTEDLDGKIVYDRPTKSTTKRPAPKPAEPKVSNKKSVTDVAAEVVAGKWGNGVERKTRLQRAGYNYSEVQDAVNAILKRR